ncbi:DUF397 domain-containing protein [Actinomadura sp. NAK00032]|nr:DUF397 domain-containing protein [Actinomadura sp. NAK00032]
MELARLPSGIGLRDSKAPAVGHVLLTQNTLATLLTQAKRG